VQQRACGAPNLSLQVWQSRHSEFVSRHLHGIFKLQVSSVRSPHGCIVYLRNGLFYKTPPLQHSNQQALAG